MSKMNRIANSKNEFQGEYKRVLCVCSAGLLRSPTAAVVLSREPFNFNTRAAGLSNEYALVVVDDVLLHWADEIVCMVPSQKHDLEKTFKKSSNVLVAKPIICLDIDDDYRYRDPELMGLIALRYSEKTNGMF